jgi:hypothetical protein
MPRRSPRALQPPDENDLIEPLPFRRRALRVDGRSMGDLIPQPPEPIEGELFDVGFG